MVNSTMKYLYLILEFAASLVEKFGYSEVVLGQEICNLEVFLYF